MDSFNIAHISYVHLGNDFFWRSTYRRRWYRNTEDPKLLTGLVMDDKRTASVPEGS